MHTAVVHCHPESIESIDQPLGQIMICLLGDFHLVSQGKRIPLNGVGKGAALLRLLAVHPQVCVARETILEELWPNTDTELAAQSLNSLVYSLHKQLGEYLGQFSPVVYCEGLYRLNLYAGIEVDVLLFSQLARRSDDLRHAGRLPEAVQAAEEAISYYQGDLCTGSSTSSILEREHLRMIFLSLQMRVAEFAFQQGDINRSLEQARHILAYDPCREDAYRLAMRCYLRRGERTAALRSYLLCAEILKKEYAAVPEPATTQLYDQIRTNPPLPG